MRLLIVGAALAAGHLGAPEHVVTQADKKFNVAAIAIRAGEKVTFRNEDAIAHNVFSATPSTPFNLAVQQPGASSSVAFPTAGEVQVRCAFHPTMKLTVTVK